jgi:hypothetical protein
MTPTHYLGIDSSWMPGHSTVTTANLTLTDTTNCRRYQQRTATTLVQ